MLSPSGKVEWLCPRCHSEDIRPRRNSPNSPWCKEGWCNDCGAVFCWRSRIKLGRKQRLVKLITGEVPDGT